MSFKNIIIVFLLSICISFSSGCSSASNTTKDASQIKGKFVFHALRDLKDPWGIYIYKNDKVKLINGKAISPLWSNDGKKIACVDDFGIVIFNEEGENIQSFPAAKGAVRIAWSPDNMQFVYTAEGSSSTKNDCIFLYDINTNLKKIIVDYDNKYAATQISFSPLGDKILFWRSDVNDIKNCGVFIYDLKTSSIVFSYPQGERPAWFPDGQHIIVLTNRNDDWSMINNKLGVFMKINIETGKREVLRDRVSFIKGLKVSADGNYFYYSKPASKGGYIIVVSPIDSPDIEIPITKPVDLGKGQGYSQDLDPDWYQGQ